MCRAESNRRICKTCVACWGNTVKKMRSQASRMAWLSSVMDISSGADDDDDDDDRSSLSFVDFDSDRFETTMERMPILEGEDASFSAAARARPLAMAEAIVPHPKNPTVMFSLLLMLLLPISPPEIESALEDDIRCS